MTASFCSLAGKTALVTGASRGIGRAIALELASAGASVVFSYRTGAEEAEALAAEIGARAVQADVSDAESARALVEEAGDIDVLVNNAGVTRDGLLVRMSDEDWHTVLDTNLASCFYTCRAAARGMMKKRSGSVVNISSIVGVHGNWGQTNYAASKAGIIGFTKAASSEARKRTAPATSEGSPRRPSGVFCSIASVASSGSTSVSCVFTYPGTTTFARTFRLPSSRASAFVKSMIPALDAA